MADAYRYWRTMITSVLMGGIILAAALTGADLYAVIVLAAAVVVQTNSADLWRDRCRCLGNGRLREGDAP